MIPVGMWGGMWGCVVVSLLCHKWLSSYVENAGKRERLEIDQKRLEIDQKRLEIENAGNREYLEIEKERSRMRIEEATTISKLQIPGL